MNTIELRLPSDHAAFEGHFPGHPIAPGVLLLDLVGRALEPLAGVVVNGFPVVKFIAPVLPGAALQLHWRREPGGIRFELFAAGKIAVKGSATLEASA